MDKIASVKIVLDPQSSDPQRTLKLRIVFNRRTYLRAIDTKLKMTESEFENATKKEVKVALKKAQLAKTTAESICEELGENFTNQEFGYRYKKAIFGKEIRKESAHTLNKVFEMYCEEHTLSQNTLVNYTSAVKWVEKFRTNCLISEISPGFIGALRTYMQKQNHLHRGKDMSISSVNMYFRGLKAICKYAMDKEIIKSNPFTGQSLESGDRPKTALTKEEWDAFARYNPQAGTNEEFAHDMAILDFCLGGPNMTDILGFTNENIKAGSITYIRQKSKDRGKPQVVTVSLTPFALSILEKYGHIEKSTPNTYVLPYYMGTKSDKEKNFRRDGVLKKINGGIRSICNKIGISPFTTYNIRHTYAIYARDLGGLDEAQIQQILGHKNIATTQRYLKGITAPLMAAHTKFVDSMMKGEEE